eukprot:15365110-Ditylum_brightwellii.AAC.1
MRSEYNNHQRNNRNNTGIFAPRMPTFEGCTHGSKGHIYDIGYALESNLFTTITRETLKYTVCTCKSNRVICVAILNQCNTIFELPALDPDLKKEVASILIQKEYDVYVKHMATCIENKTNMYDIVYVQCLEVMKAKLDIEESFAEVATESDTVKLLGLI